MKDLTLNEASVLLSIIRLEHNAYGVAIKREVEKFMKKKISYGTLYSYLDQLFRKGFISKEMGLPTPERGGRRKTFYRITKKGIDALDSAFQIQKSIWTGLSGLAKNKV